MPFCSSARLLPHGGYSLIPTVLTTMAWIAAFFQDNCSYAITSNKELIDTLTFGNNGEGIQAIELGYMAYRIPKDSAGAEHFEWYGHCFPYPEQSIEFDWTWGFARFCSFVSLVLGGGATFYLWTSTCYPFELKSWKWAGGEVAFACLFQALSFVWFANGVCQSSSCTLHYGAKSDILSTVFFLLATLAIVCHYPKPKAASGGGREGEQVDGIMVDPASGQQQGVDQGNVESEEVQNPEQGIEMATNKPALEDVQIS